MAWFNSSIDKLPVRSAAFWKSYFIRSMYVCRRGRSVFEYPWIVMMIPCHDFSILNHRCWREPWTSMFLNRISYVGSVESNYLEQIGFIYIILYHERFVFIQWGYYASVS